jgi:hypothetical protein
MPAEYAARLERSCEHCFFDFLRAKSACLFAIRE